MIRNIILAALKSGPFAGLCFTLMIEDQYSTDTLMIFIITSFLCCIIALFAALLLFNLFDALLFWFKLTLTNRQRYHFFMPFLVFFFGGMACVTSIITDDTFSLSFLYTTYLTSLFSWTVYSASQILHKKI